MFNWQNWVQIAINAFITGACASFGMYIVTKHIVGRIDNKKNRDKETNEPPSA